MRRREAGKGDKIILKRPENLPENYPPSPPPCSPHTAHSSLISSSLYFSSWMYLTLGAICFTITLKVVNRLISIFLWSKKINLLCNITLQLSIASQPVFFWRGLLGGFKSKHFCKGKITYFFWSDTLKVENPMCSTLSMGDIFLILFSKGFKPQ